MGRIALFILTNILVIAAVSIIFSLLGFTGYVDAGGINYQALMVFCLIWGMVGSVISLLLSKKMAKWMLKVQVIPPEQAGELQYLVQMVHEFAKGAGLSKMPEVGVYPSDDVNAFATGPSKSNSLVAFSSGILRSMNQEELRGVAAHEVAHIQNGDMVTMTLIQGVINAFVMFFARIIAHAISNAVDERYATIVHFLSVIILQIAFGFLGLIVTSWFSRKREFRADAGSAKLAGANAMIAGLEALKRRSPTEGLPDSMAALGISGGAVKAMFSTHPPLDERIAALKGLK